jgi:GSH-dependent disulfide-bond oxidoreductase
VPTLVDSNSDTGPFVLTQSNAISLYAAAKSPGSLLPADDPRKAAVALERHFYFVTDVITQSFAAFSLLKRGYGDAASALNSDVLAAVIAAERFLSETFYVAGDEFSLADISAYTITLFLEKQIDWDAHLRLRRWFDLVGTRPGVLRGIGAFRNI